MHDPIESEDSAAFDDAWDDFKTFAAWVAAAVAWAYALAPVFQFRAWGML